MWRALKDWGLALLIAAVVFVVVGRLGGGAPTLPEQAPGFTLTSLDGEPLALDSLQGQTVVLNFWASWCGPCREEIPEFARFHADHPEVAILGLAVDSGKEPDVRRAARSFGITWPVALASAEVVAAYDVSSLPTTVVIDPEGRVHKATVGAMSYRELFRALP